MRLKDIAKYLFTRFNCLIFNVKYQKCLYVGYGVKIVGGGKIILNRKVEVMPYAMMVSLRDGRIEVGEGSCISMFSRVASRGYVKFGKYVEMGPNCFIADFNHEYRDVTKPVKLQGLRFTPSHDGNPTLEIGDGSWIGTHVTIVGNIRIGKHCVVGANSVVVHDVPDYCVVAGTPAKVVKKYNTQNQQWEKV